MRIRSFLAAALLALAAFVVACQPAPGGGTESQAAPSQGQASDAAAPANPGPSETPRDNPNY